MIYLFGNYRALGELGTIDNESQELGGGWGDLILPPTSVFVYVCVYLYVCVHAPTARGCIKRLIFVLTSVKIF